MNRVIEHINIQAHCASFLATFYKANIQWEIVITKDISIIVVCTTTDSCKKSKLPEDHMSVTMVLL